MGDISIIARRLSPKYVQYGWSGNGGCFKSVGVKLLEWYNTQDDKLIDYLFELGQFRNLGSPGSEKGGSPWYFTHDLTGENHYVGTTERDIFSKILFIDYGYFYDSDKVWYYIIPGPFRIKIPLEVIENNLDSDGYEFNFRKTLGHVIIKHMFEQYIKKDTIFSHQLTEHELDPNDIKNTLLSSEHPIMDFFDKYRRIFAYFDDWIVITATDDKKDIQNVYLRPKSTIHQETIEWVLEKDMNET